MSALSIIIICRVWLLSILTYANTGQSPQRLTVTGAVGPSSADISIEIKTDVMKDQEGLDCRKRDATPNALCVTDIPQNSRNTRVIISAPGYKRFYVNAPLVVHHGEYMLDIGNVKLARAELIDIEHIYYSKQFITARRSSFHHLFKVVIHNELKREMLIKKAEIHIFREGDRPPRCLTPGAESADIEINPVYIFNISNRLTIVTGGNETYTISGEHNERKGVVPASGRMSVMGCGRFVMVPLRELLRSSWDSTSLTLDIPTAFTIPQDEFSIVEIKIPDRFVLGDKSGERKHVDFESIDEFRVSFSTSNGENPVIRRVWNKGK